MSTDENQSASPGQPDDEGRLPLRKSPSSPLEKRRKGIAERRTSSPGSPPVWGC